MSSEFHGLRLQAYIRLRSLVRARPDHRPDVIYSRSSYTPSGAHQRYYQSKECVWLGVSTRIRNNFLVPDCRQVVMCSEGVSIIRAPTVPMVRSFPEILELEPNSPEDGDKNLGEIDPLRDATLGVSVR
jgi:hypothetical protein